MIIKIIIFWLTASFVLTGTIIAVSTDCFTDSSVIDSLLPKVLYDNTELNYFGIGLLLIFLFICMPYYYIAYFIYWITHVGRKVEY